MEVFIDSHLSALPYSKSLLLPKIILSTDRLSFTKKEIITNIISIWQDTPINADRITCPLCSSYLKNGINPRFKCSSKMDSDDHTSLNLHLSGEVYIL